MGAPEEALDRAGSGSKADARGRRIAALSAGVLLLVAFVIATQREAPQPSGRSASEPISDPWARTPPNGATRPDDPSPRMVGPTLPSSKPTMVDIPAIDVHPSVLSIGLAAGGTLDGPPPGPDYDRAAWYRSSSTPGSLGPAILLGHVDSAADGPSVFFRLGELRPGDRVSVTRADGSVAVFIVDEVRRYAKAAFPTDLVYGNIDHAGLRLLTCGGPFDSRTGHYLDNIVVFASLVVPR